MPSLLKRGLIFVHRWLGVLLTLFFLLWFPSAIGIMYWDFPSVRPADRIARAAAIDTEKVRLTPAEAYATLELEQPPGQVRLSMFDGRPVYRFRVGREENVVYADTGDERIAVPRDMVDRIATAWTGQPVSAAAVEAVTEIDQWMVQSGVTRYAPLWKYSWPNGEQAYVSQATAEVVQYTTTGSRWGAYVGAIPHWLYFTPLRKHGPQWSRVVIWSSGIATGTAILGLIVGVWMYSPSKRYRYDGAPTRVPYRGQKRWHMVLGLVFGVATVTWAFSGMLSMEPFPLTREPAAGRRGDGGAGIARMLRTRTRIEAFAGKSPRQALEQLHGLTGKELVVKEIELTSVAGLPVYLATMAPGNTRLVPVDGEPLEELNRDVLIDLVKKAANPGVAEIRVIDQYDRYYLDRRRQQPLPVIMARLDDEAGTRLYIDPKTARVVGNYSGDEWMSRWLYHGLHSFDFPWLYNYRPLWDIIVITFMLGGTALGITSLVLAWRVLGRKVAAVAGRSREMPAGDVLVAESE